MNFVGHPPLFRPRIAPDPSSGWLDARIHIRTRPVQGGDSCSSSQPRNARSEQTLVFPTRCSFTPSLSSLRACISTREGKETKGRTTSCQTGYDTGTSVRGGDEYETIQGGGRIGIFQRSKFHHGDGSGWGESLSGAHSSRRGVYFSIGASDSLFQSLLRSFHPSIFLSRVSRLFLPSAREKKEQGRNVHASNFSGKV